MYRIAQEALNNVAKHSGASKATVTIHYLAPPANGVELCVEDDGHGFDVSSVPPDHLGLHIMDERAQSIGAEVSVSSQPGHGTSISVIWVEDDGEDDA